MEVSLKALVGKLDPAVHQALDEAAQMCRAMTNYDVELEHFLLKLLESDAPDVAPLLRHFDVDRSRLARELTLSAEKLKRGNTRDTPGISPHVPELLEGSWLYASIERGAARIQPGDVLYALVADPELARIARGCAHELGRLEPARLAEVLGRLGRPAQDEAEAGPPDGNLPPRRGEALERFTIDLTARARAGEIDPVLGRDAEIRQMVDILLRRRQNNPILTGEPGVGKTAVVEGLALRIAQDDVPEPLRGNELRTLDLGLLQAGAGVRGEFEERLKNVIAEVKQSPTPIVLFIDEAHTLIGSGGGEGQSDAANLLKPALARGELRTIAATTWAEYKKYFEKDAALARRFQVVKLDEPDEKTALVMLRGIADKIEAHHRVKITPEALEAAVRFSARYLSDRQLPDKAVSVLDTACARVAVGRGATPAALEDARRKLDALRTEERLLLREKGAGVESTVQAERLARLTGEIAAGDQLRRSLEQRWIEEKAYVQSILAAREELEALARDGKDASPAREDVLARLKAAEQELRHLQGEQPLVAPYVDASVVASVVGQWTGIPVGRMLSDEIQTVLGLQALLAERVVGQDHALDAIARRIHTSRARLEDPARPVGVFLLVGPSGVGKTETALALAELLYGGERNLITINMSEFQEAHTVASLKGSPPGYVGYGEGGVLTEAVRRRPYSVVLLDEVEKAHPDVMELFYQVFDKGALEDGQGRRIDFKNTILLLTSNLASQTIVRHAAQAAQANGCIDGAQLAKAIHPELTGHFKPALVGRMVVVPYLPLSDEVLRDIARLKLERVRRRLDEHHRVPFGYDEAVLDALLARCAESDIGARNLDHVISGSILPEASRLVLGALAQGRAVRPLTVRAAGGRLEVHEQEEPWEQR